MAAEIDREHEQFTLGVNHGMALLAGRLGSPEYYAADGSEDYDQDVADTFMNLLAAAGIYDKEENAIATIKKVDALKARVAELEAQQRSIHATASATVEQ